MKNRASFFLGICQGSVLAGKKCLPGIENYFEVIKKLILRSSCLNMEGALDTTIKYLLLKEKTTGQYLKQ